MKRILLSTPLIWTVSSFSCDFPYKYDLASSFSSQVQLDSRLAGCTIVDGWLSIAHNYTGSFVLNNITTITGGIGTYDEATSDVSTLTSIQANGLLNIQELSIYRVPTLKNISFPDLISIDKIGLDLASDDGDVRFPSLVKATTMSIFGPISRMDFSSLTTVTNQLSVSSNNTIDVPDPANPIVKEYPPFDIDFPRLKTCSQIILYGNISSVSMPMLWSSVPGPGSSGGGITIATNGNPLVIAFPKLSNTTEIALTGTIGSFSFPSLMGINGGFSVDSFYPSDFNFAPLESATILTLQGNVTGLDLSTMKELHQLHVTSDVPLDCTSAAESWARIQNTALIKDPNEQHHSPAWQGFICESSSSTHNGLSKMAKLKIGLSAGISVPVVLILAYYTHKKLARSRAREVKPPAYEHELEDRYMQGEDLPSYVPREAETTDALSEVSSLSDNDGIRRSLDGRPVSPHHESIHAVVGSREEHQ